MIDVQAASGSFGVARVLGLESGKIDEASGALRGALAAHAVLCIPLDRRLDEPELESLAGLVGPIKDPVAPTKQGEELRYSPTRQVIDSGFVITDEVREKLGALTFGGLDDQRPGLFETYHCDDTYTENPAWATILHARRLPPSGGGPTCFIDMRAAYAKLDPATQRELESLRVRYAYNNEDAFPPRRAARGPAEALIEVCHPLIRTHPIAQTRSLFLDLDRATQIEGMPIAEGRKLLRELQEHAETKASACQHTWADHDVLIWDNASVQHKAGGDFPVGEPRRFWRYMIAGDRPA